MLLGAGCAGGEDVENPGSASSEGPVQEVVGPAGLERCEDVAAVTPSLEGNLGARQNPDPAVMDLIGAYRDEHAGTFGGTWIDRAYRVVVVAFTDDPEAHREAILTYPPPGGDSEADLRPLGEQSEVTIDVVQVRYSKAELEGMHQQIMGAVSGRDFADSLMTLVLITKNRLNLSLFNPPEGTLDELVELVPDVGAVCISVSYLPDQPTGPLELIPDLDVEDPLVICHGIPPVPYSRLVDPPPIDQVDHPAVEALRAELEAPGAEPMPTGRWVVISIGDDLATFAALSPDSFGHAEFRRHGDRWRLGGVGIGPSCEPTVALPDGLNRLNRVAISLDPGSPPDPDSRTIHVLATEQACASGREMGDDLQGPQVVETDSAVLIAFVAIPLAERLVNCQGNPSTPVTIELSRPLGDRTIYDGLYVPPKPLEPESE